LTAALWSKMEDRYQAVLDHPGIPNEEITVEPRLTDRLWQSIAPTYGQILRHPFVAGLGDGSLERDSFQFYVVQDALYLREFARALAICAAKAPGDDAIEMFCRHAVGAIAVERQLHESFISEMGLSEATVQGAEMAPTALAYTSYLLAIAYGGSFPEVIGAVLPCYWIYWEVGKALSESSPPDPLYRRWIDTYAGEEFTNIVKPVLALTDELGARLSRSEEAKVARHFRTTARLEWMFWNMGYKKEGWPV
jgi:thiaminase (transcriptional activator TenA)